MAAAGRNEGSAAGERAARGREGVWEQVCVGGWGGGGKQAREVGAKRARARSGAGVRASVVALLALLLLLLGVSLLLLGVSLLHEARAEGAHRAQRAAHGLTHGAGHAVTRGSS